MATNTVTPPPGFALDNPTQDRSSAAPPPGFVLEDSPAQNAHPEKPMGERIAQGFGAAAGETLINAGRLGAKIPGVSYVADKIGDIAGLPKLAPGVNPYDAVEQGTANAREQSLNNTAGKVGYGLENLAEFVTGDEALKGLSYGEKLTHAAKVAKILEKSPKLARAVEIGMNSMRQAAVGTTQGLAHGESGTEALESGALAGGTGAVLEGGIEGLKTIAPKLREIAGELIPVRASQESAVAKAGESVAPSKTLQQFDIAETQPGAKKAIGKIASDIGTKEISNAAPMAPAADIGERAEQIRAQAKPVFEKLDDLTKDRENTFSDYQKQEKFAYRKGDYEAVTKAKASQQSIIEEFKDKFAPDDLKNARSAWAQSIALDKVDHAFTTKAVLQPTPVEFRPKGIADPGVINGNAFSKVVLNLKTKGTFDAAGLTAEHVQDLQDLGTLLENGNNVKKLSSLFSPRNAALAEGLGFALHPATAIAAAKVGVPTYAVSKILGNVMTSPVTAKRLVTALRWLSASDMAPAAATQIPRQEKSEP